MIENYPNLQSIIVKKDSLENLNSLKICNCDKLKTIEVEGDREYFGSKFLAHLSGKDIKYLGALYNVKKVIIESISEII